MSVLLLLFEMKLFDSLNAVTELFFSLTETDTSKTLDVLSS